MSCLWGEVFKTSSSLSSNILFTSTISIPENLTEILSSFLACSRHYYESFSECRRVTPSTYELLINVLDMLEVSEKCSISIYFSIFCFSNVRGLVVEQSLILSSKREKASFHSHRMENMHWNESPVSLHDYLPIQITHPTQVCLSLASKIWTLTLASKSLY